MAQGVDYKEEAKEQWTVDPCGASGAGDRAPGSPEFYDAIDADRYQAYAPWLKEFVGFDRYRDRDVLEIGFGLGTDLMQFARAGARVSGVDLSPRHLELARRRFELAGIPAQLQNADAEKLPFPDASFDVVYSFGVLHHTPDTERAFAEAHRVLRPGGLFIVALYHRWSLYSFVHTMRWLLKGWWRSESLRDSWYRIEFQSSKNSARPLVKRYSRGQLRRLTERFSTTRIACQHLGGKAALLAPWPFDGLAARLAGWYIFAFATK
jgi:ubiquinone/menaquinone biosynthesis C-methylase UbiE